VHEDVFTAVIADDEAKSLLGIEEFYDAFAFANDLRWHSATVAAATAAETAATPAAETATTAAAVAATITAVAATAAAAVTPATGTWACTPFLKAKISTAERFFAEHIVALVTTTTAAIPFAPFIETHLVRTSLPESSKTTALGLLGATGRARKPLTHRSRPYSKKTRHSRD
jgi:hypothetical protein